MMVMMMMMMMGKLDISLRSLFTDPNLLWLHLYTVIMNVYLSETFHWTEKSVPDVTHQIVFDEIIGKTERRTRSLL